MILIEHDDMIDEFALAGSNPSLCRPVLPWTPERRSLGSDPDRVDLLRDVRRENCVVVEDQVARGRIVRERLAELLDYPLGRGIGRDVEMDDSTSSMFNDEPHI